MKNQMKHFIPYSKEEIKKLWEDSLIVFDTNILISLYELPKTSSDAILNQLEARKDKVWMPPKVAEEYLSQRGKKISKLASPKTTLRGAVENFFNQCLDFSTSKAVSDKINELREISYSAIDEWDIEVVNVSHENDYILNKLLLIYDGRIGKPFTKDEYKGHKDEYHRRRKQKIPPGYMEADNTPNQEGDYIIWLEMINKSKESNQNVIFVTQDLKEDWWEINGEQYVGLHNKLREEFYELTKKDCLIFTHQEFTELENEIFGRTSIDKEVAAEIDRWQTRNELAHRIIYKQQKIDTKQKTPIHNVETVESILLLAENDFINLLFINIAQELSPYLSRVDENRRQDLIQNYSRGIGKQMFRYQLSRRWAEWFVQYQELQNYEYTSTQKVVEERMETVNQITNILLEKIVDKELSLLVQELFGKVDFSLTEMKQNTITIVYDTLVSFIEDWY